jgi:apolipoprotein N-acyltransferase
VPGFEASLFEKGVSDIPVITTPYGKIAMVICYDADFSQFVKQVGKNKADILLIPGNDWEEIAPYHTRLSYFRGIENGVSIFSAANMATMGAADPYGKVIQEKSTFDFENGTSMKAQVPTKRVNTLYAILGDWFAWVCVFLTGACVLYMVITPIIRCLLAKNL